MDSGDWPTVYGIMPKAKQTSINYIFLRNPVPNDDRKEENQTHRLRYKYVIETENEDADAAPVKKWKTKW